MLKTIKFCSFKLSDIENVKNFTDNLIGVNYYLLEDLKLIQEQSCSQDENASLLAYKNNQLIGVRLSLAPNNWISTHLKISPSLWQLATESVAYFKSLFIDQNYRNLGLGRQMSQKSQEILIKMGAKAIVTHSWLESPGNSSQAYLKKSQFIELARYPKFWNHIDYLCTRCAPKRCECTAVEMIKYIS